MQGIMLQTPGLEGWTGVVCEFYAADSYCGTMQFFAHLLATDAISWAVVDHIRLTEDDTTSSSRIFIKHLFQVGLVHNTLCGVPPCSILKLAYGCSFSCVHHVATEVCHAHPQKGQRPQIKAFRAKVFWSSYKQVDQVLPGAFCLPEVPMSQPDVSTKSYPS